MSMSQGPQPRLSYAQVKALAVLASPATSALITSGRKSRVAYPGWSAQVATQAVQFLERHGLATSHFHVPGFGKNWKITSRGQFRAEAERTGPRTGERWARAMKEISGHG